MNVAAEITLINSPHVRDPIENHLQHLHVQRVR